MIIPAIIFDYLFRHFFTNCSGKISVFPKFSAPKPCLYFGVLVKYYADTDTLRHPKHFANTLPRGKRQINVNVMLCYLHRIYFKIVTIRDLLKYLLYSPSDIASQNPFSLFRSLQQKVFSIVNRMTGSFQFPADRYIISIPAFGRRTFHPRLQNGVLKF